MTVHGYSSLPHYGDHIAPILDALPDDVAGEMWTPSERKPWGLPIGPRTPRDGLWIVASYADARKMLGRPLVLLQHGAGQSYFGDSRSAGHGAFVGGDGMDDVRLFVVPSQRGAARWQERYPHVPVAVVGCPRMDPWHQRIAGDSARIRHTTPLERPVVAVTFHHEQAQIPEQTSARTFLRDALPALRDYIQDDLGGTLLGHGHPRNWPNLRRLWRSLDVPCTEYLSDVFDRADVLVVDNSSAAYEFASLGKPIVWVSPPWYRRDVHHEMRFWEDVAGLPHVETLEDLIPMVNRALADPAEDQAARVAMVRRTYAYTDGHAADWAAAAILDLVR